MKRFCSIALAAALTFSALPTVAFAADEINVTVAGTPVVWTDAKPFINEDSRTLVPLRPIADALGLTVEWNAETKQATFAKVEEETVVKSQTFTIGEAKYTTVVGEENAEAAMDTAAVIAEERTYAPARYLAEFFGYTVTWDDATKTVGITEATAEAPVEDTSYKFTAADVEIESREVKVPATVTIPEAKTEGETFPLVVMAHGHGGSKEENGGFTAVAEALAKAGIATVRMDYPGCGASTETFQHNTLTNMIADTKACADYVVENYPINKDKLGLFGYSMGGRIATTIATENAYDIDGMVLLAPANDGDTMKAFFGGEEEFNKLYDTAKKDGFVEFTTMFGAKQELSKEFFEDLLASDPLKDVSKYDGKTLVIFGEDDNVVLPTVSKATAEALKAETLDVTGDTHSYSFYSEKPEIRENLVSGTVELFTEAFK